MSKLDLDPDNPDESLVPCGDIAHAPLQVLLWSDSDDLAQITLTPLRDAGFDIAHRRVQDIVAYRAALLAHDWHLIMFDESAGRRESLAALRMLRTEGGGAHDAPFIFVATYVNAAIVIEAVRAGATDCVARSDTSRLAHAVARELALAERLAEQRAARREIEEREARARRAGQMFPHGLCICDPRGRITYFNRVAAQLWGRSPEIGTDLWCGSRRMWLPDGQPLPLEDSPMALAVRQRRACTDVEVVIERPDGSRRYVQCSAQPVFDEATGAFAGAVNILLDVTERRQHLQQLRLAEQVFAQSREGVVITDANRRVLMVNQAFTDISGYAADEILGRTPAMLSSQRQDETYYQSIWEEVSQNGEWQGEVWNRNKDGNDRPTWLKATAVRDSAGTITNYVGTFLDIGEQKAASERIERLSNFDALTGLPNRSLLADRCTQALHRARRKGSTLAMLVLGIDDFMTVNDAQGHAIGNQLLQQFARRIHGVLRTEDTLARIGGDEFVALLPAQSPEEASVMAARLNHLAAQPFRINDTDICVTASIGAAMYSRDGLDFDSLFKSAELAMHEAKKQQRGGFRFFSTQMYEHTVAKVTMVAALRNAMAQGQLSLHYQAFADLETGRIGGMEALLRWRHPTLGIVPPSEFIPVAEQSGLIVALGAWALREACQDLRRWLDHGLEVPSVSVNLSPLQLRDQGLVRHIEATLHEFRIEPHRLCIEVTEGALMEDVRHSETVLQALKSLGVSLSLDDFGTGYSSLSYLKLFPFDTVKLDQSFVRGLNEHAHDELIAKVVISMAHGLGLRVVAEGVETDAQCEFLRANLCDFVQGYFFARPIPADLMRTMLASEKHLPPHLLLARERPRTVLLVTTDEAVAQDIAGVLSPAGVRMLRVASGHQALEALRAESADIAVADDLLPDMPGLELMARVKTLDASTMRIVLAGAQNADAVERAVGDGIVHRILVRPWNAVLLRQRVVEIFENRELIEENQRLGRKIRGANLELATANRQLQELLRQKQQKIEHRELSLKVMREALQCMPVAVVGIDEDGLVAFVNQQTRGLLGEDGLQLGAELRDRQPALAELLDAWLPGRDEPILAVNGHRLRVGLHVMGEQSTARGKVVTLTALPAPATASER